MKKIVLAAALFLAVNTALAGKWYAAGEIDTAENRNTHADTVGTSVIVGYKNSNWQYSGKLSTSQEVWGKGSISNTYEGRVKRSFSIVGTKPYLQSRLGEKVTATSSFAYYALDVGLVIPVTDIADVDVSYRYRDSFSEDNYQTNRYSIEGKIRVADDDLIGLRYAQSYGDSETDSWRLQYAHYFK